MGPEPEPPSAFRAVGKLVEKPRLMGRANLDPKAWGPPGWAFLSACAAACDEESAAAYRAFFQLLPNVLPCESCRAHAREYVRVHPPDAAALVAWLERVRRAVAQRTSRSDGRRWKNAALFFFLFLFLCCVLLAVGGALR